MKKVTVLCIMICVSIATWAQTANELEQLRSKADRGDAEAQYLLADYYWDNENINEAAKWLSKSTANGFAAAQWEMGFLAMENKNYSEALKWYRKSADQNFCFGQYSLGCCYYDGAGVEKDWSIARNWFEKALTNYKKASREELRFYERAKFDGNKMVEEIDKRINEIRAKAQTTAKNSNVAMVDGNKTNEQKKPKTTLATLARELDAQTDGTYDAIRNSPQGLIAKDIQVSGSEIMTQYKQNKLTAKAAADKLIALGDAYVPKLNDPELLASFKKKKEQREYFVKIDQLENKLKTLEKGSKEYYQTLEQCFDLYKVLYSKYYINSNWDSYVSHLRNFYNSIFNKYKIQAYIESITVGPERPVMNAAISHGMLRDGYKLVKDYNDDKVDYDIDILAQKLIQIGNAGFQLEDKAYSTRFAKLRTATENLVELVQLNERWLAGMHKNPETPEAKQLMRRYLELKQLVEGAGYKFGPKSDLEVPLVKVTNDILTLFEETAKK